MFFHQNIENFLQLRHAVTLYKKRTIDCIYRKNLKWEENYLYIPAICVSCMFITTWQFGWMINNLWKKKSKMLTLNKYYEAMELCVIFSSNCSLCNYHEIVANDLLILYWLLLYNQLYSYKVTFQEVLCRFQAFAEPT